MQIQRKSLYIIRATCDIFILMIAFYLSVIFVSDDKFWVFKHNEHYLLAILALTWIYSSEVTELYDEFRSRYPSEELLIVIKNLIVQPIIAVVALFFIIEIDLNRSFVLVYASVLFVSILIEKYLIRKAIIAFRKRGRNSRNLLIIGAGEVGKNFYDTIIENPQFGYKMAGFIDDNDKLALNGLYLGKIKDLEKAIIHNNVKDVIVALPNYAAYKIEEIINICEKQTVRVKIIPDYFKFLSEKYRITQFGSFPLISVRNEQINELHSRLLKRLFDFVFTLLLSIIVLSWLIPLIALLVKLSSPGKAFFIQERWGKDNKKIRCYKFRSMRENTPEIDGSGKYLQAKKNDPRVTKIGRFLRKTNLDEIPQFFNVLKGEMSVVGPRPHPTPLNIESRDKIQHYMMRHIVKPGITGWAQINGLRGETSDSKLMQKRIEFDLWYIENWDLWLDIKIIIMTVWKMFSIDEKAY